jgi:hypothetical protein
MTDDPTPRKRERRQERREIKQATGYMARHMTVDEIEQQQDEGDQ